MYSGNFPLGIAAVGVQCFVLLPSVIAHRLEQCKRPSACRPIHPLLRSQPSRVLPDVDLVSLQSLLTQYESRESLLDGQCDLKTRYCRLVGNDLSHPSCKDAPPLYD
jgi:hypothetical protein